VSNPAKSSLISFIAAISEWKPARKPYHPASFLFTFFKESSVDLIVFPFLAGMLYSPKFSQLVDITTDVDYRWSFSDEPESSTGESRALSVMF